MSFNTPMCYNIAMEKQTPKKTNPTIAFVATPEIVQALESRSKKEERSISWLIRKALEAYLHI